MSRESEPEKVEDRTETASLDEIRSKRPAPKHQPAAHPANLANLMDAPRRSIGDTGSGKAKCAKGSRQRSNLRPKAQGGKANPGSSPTDPRTTFWFARLAPTFVACVDASLRRAVQGILVLAW